MQSNWNVWVSIWVTHKSPEVLGALSTNFPSQCKGFVGHPVHPRSLLVPGGVEQGLARAPSILFGRAE